MTELSAPLSRRKVRLSQARQRGPWRIPVGRLSLALLLLLVGGVGLYVLLVEDQQGGRPSATAEIAGGTASSIVDELARGDLPVTITPDPEMYPAPVDPAEDVALVGMTAQGLLPDLLEETAFGAIPRMSTTGERPFDAYARPVDGAAAAIGTPMISIIVSGLGINGGGTLDAIEALPAEVTLGFAPYGNTLLRSVEAARTDGHEILLEVPLEPFDYPDNDPGPDTLLTGKAPRENLGRLFSIMSRFGGYVGLLNNMGARFTASSADFAPVMEELGARGLGYLDDGSSNRSLAKELARANRVPFARVDAMLDANPARARILEQLAALESKAKRSGSAIGIVSALPVSVEVVAEWARGLSEKGIVLVPASALMKDGND